MTIVVSTTISSPQTYSKLKVDVARWLATDDLSQEIVSFIQLAESDLCKDVRVRGMETSIVYTLNGSPQVLPQGFLGMRRIYLDSENGRELTYMPPERFYTSRAYTSSGQPAIYTIEGNSIIFAPAASPEAPIDASLLYIKPYESLTEDGDSNSLLTKSYDLYLYCALMHGFSFMRDDDQAVKYKGKYDESVLKVNRNANHERSFGRKLVRTGGPTP